MEEKLIREERLDTIYLRLNKKTWQQRWHYAFVLVLIRVPKHLPLTMNSLSSLLTLSFVNIKKSSEFQASLHYLLLLLLSSNMTVRQPEHQLVFSKALGVGLFKLMRTTTYIPSVSLTAFSFNFPCGQADLVSLIIRY